MYSYEIYIERVFIINLVLNILILILTAKTLKLSVTRIRILAGGILGALGYCIILLLPLTYRTKIAVGLIPISILMCVITFRTKGLRNVLRQTGYLFIYAFLIGAVMIFLQRQVPFAAKYSGGGWLIISLGYTVYAVLDYFLKIHRRHEENFFVDVSIPCLTEEINIIALVDTGNGLTEPVSKKPVAVLEEKVWEQLKPLMKPEKTKAIPYHNIGNAHGLMIGYELEEIYITKSGQRERYENIVVAVGPGGISQSGDYQMIINPKLINNLP
ncbi:MAG: sigma-E processing peptidase SpoIIGA [Lachnospiraceae bacterium]|nr:sigma-E processing peptidase SpoIIGA [Lachnospiraceae bacterium]